MSRANPGSTRALELLVQFHVRFQMQKYAQRLPSLLLRWVGNDCTQKRAVYAMMLCGKLSILQEAQLCDVVCAALEHVFKESDPPPVWRQQVFHGLKRRFTPVSTRA
jgi:hypothetical protein